MTLVKVLSCILKLHVSVMYVHAGVYVCEWLYK